MRGSVFGQAGRHQEALADFNKAISLDPNYAQAYANRGLIYRQTGKLDLALADYNKALQLDPNYAVAYLGRGIVYRQRKQTLDAFNDFNKAIAIRPDSAQAYYNRGLLYQSQRQHQFAIDDFSTAIGLTQNAGRALCRARPELPGDRRLQSGGQPISTTRCRPSRTTCRPGPAAASPTSGSATGEGGRLLRQGAQHQPGPRSRRSRASRASAARSARPTRRSEHGRGEDRGRQRGSFRNARTASCAPCSSRSLWPPRRIARSVWAHWRARTAARPRRTAPRDRARRAGSGRGARTLAMRSSERN